MKRSEMIVEMAEHWIGSHGLSETGDRVLFSEVCERMGGLLNMIENRGMKPPVIAIDPVLYTVQHVWEKEDA